MFSVEDLCSKITQAIVQEIGVNEEKKSVINYGIFAIVQMMSSIILILIFGLIFNVALEALIIIFTISLLRQSSGGVHASTPSSCLIISTVYSLSGGLICKNIRISEQWTIILAVVIFALAYYILWKLAPVDSKAKPIRSIEKRRGLKRKSIFILTVYLILQVINFSMFYFMGNRSLLVYNQCIYMGILWQIFSLTKIGHDLLGKIDSIFT